MATKIEDIYDAMVAKLVANLPATYKRLPDPYNPPANTYLNLEQGYGIAIGPGENTNRTVSCLSTWRRTFTIIIVNQVTATPNDTGSRVLVEKGLLVDQDSIFRAFEKDVTLGGIAMQTAVLGDSGIQSLEAELLRFQFIETILEVEYEQIP